MWQQSIGSEIQCDNATGQVSLAFGYCMTYSNASGKLQPVTIFTNLNYLSFSNGVHVTLPKNISELHTYQLTNINLLVMIIDFA